MSPGERRILEFIASRLESMLRRPRMWGSLLSVEDSILQLLELRRVLLVPSASASDTQRLMQTYTQFISRALDNATAEPLAIQLERQDRAAEFTSYMAKFIDAELATFLVEEREDLDAGHGSGRAADLEMTARVLESLRMDAEARARRVPTPMEPIDFPELKPN
jgi:hypothetical protein